MKIPDRHSAITMIGICARKTLTLSLIWLTLILAGNAQSKSVTASSGELYDTISSLDSSFFEAYNKCELARIDPFFTDDVEFYHEMD